ncbi:MAG: hypothetical protein ACKO24_15720 [Leptolyngbyaceae cyanobacterium]
MPTEFSSALLEKHKLTARPAGVHADLCNIELGLNHLIIRGKGDLTLGAYHTATRWLAGFNFNATLSESGARTVTGDATLAINGPIIEGFVNNPGQLILSELFYALTDFKNVL